MLNEQYDNLEILDKINGITFNEDEEDLKCEYMGDIIRCKVSEDHFKGKNESHYYLKYNNLNIDINNKTTSFFTSPIKVILSDNKDKDKDKNKSNESNGSDGSNSILVISIVASIIIIIIIFFVIYIIIKKSKIPKNESLKNDIKDMDYLSLNNY